MVMVGVMTLSVHGGSWHTFFFLHSGGECNTAGRMRQKQREVLQFATE